MTDSPTPSEPRTRAGRNFLADGEDRFFDWTYLAETVRQAVVDIESEAAVAAIEEIASKWAEAAEPAALREALERLLTNAEIDAAAYIDADVFAEARAALAAHPEPAALDVERLAEALHEVGAHPNVSCYARIVKEKQDASEYARTEYWPSSVEESRSSHREQARAILARLQSPDPSP